MTDEELVAAERTRHEAEVRDWARRIRAQPPNKRADYWRKWRQAICDARGIESAREVDRDVKVVIRAYNSLAKMTVMDGRDD